MVYSEGLGLEEGDTGCIMTVDRDGFMMRAIFVEPGEGRG